MKKVLDTGNGPNKELLSLFGLSVDDAARRIGTSRAAVENGRTGGASGRPVLNEQDVILLRFRERLFRKDMRTHVDEKAVIDHMRTRYGDEVADTVREVFDRMAQPYSLEPFKEIWLILSDVRHAITSGEAEYIRELLHFPGAVTFYTGSPVDQEKLQEFIGAEAIKEKGSLLTFKDDVAIQSWSGTSLVGDPHGTAVSFQRGTAWFVYAPVQNARAFVQWLDERAQRSPLQRLVED